MFRRTPSKQEPESGNTPSAKKLLPSLIASDVNMLGNIISDGVIDFDGKLDGNLKCRVVHVRANAVINGEITAEEAFIQGTVKGTINAKTVTLHGGAYVDGIVMHETITVEDGATIDGKLKKTNKPSNDFPPTPSLGNFDAPSDQEPLSPARLMENIRLIASH